MEGAHITVGICYGHKVESNRLPIHNFTIIEHKWESNRPRDLTDPNQIQADNKSMKLLNQTATYADKKNSARSGASVRLRELSAAQALPAGFPLLRAEVAPLVLKHLLHSASSGFGAWWRGAAWRLVGRGSMARGRGGRWRRVKEAGVDWHQAETAA